MARDRGKGIEFIDVLPEEGERRLMLAVLIDAVWTYKQNAPQKPWSHPSRAWLRERQWFRSDDRSRAFSFVNVCEALGLDAGYVRRWLMRAVTSDRSVRVRRYARKAEEAWERQRRHHRAPSGARQAGGGWAVSFRVRS